MEERYCFMSNVPYFSDIIIMFGSGFHVSYMGGLRNGGLCACMLPYECSVAIKGTGCHGPRGVFVAMRRTSFDTSSN